MFTLLYISGTASEYATHIDKIVDALIKSGDGFNHFFAITKGLWAFFYVLLVGFIVYQARSTQSSINYYQLLKPIVFLILFELCFADGVGVADRLSESVGREMSGDRVTQILFKQSKVDINQYYDEQIKKAQEDNFWVRKTGLRKPVFIIIQRTINEDRDKWNKMSDIEKAEMIVNVLDEAAMLDGMRGVQVTGILAENTGISSASLLSPGSVGINGIALLKVFRDPDKLNDFIKQIEANAKEYASTGQLFIMEGNTNSQFINYSVIPLINMLNQIGYTIMYEIRSLYLTVLKFLAFFAFAFSVFYSTSDSWKKWLHQYICVLLWIVPLKIAELMMLFLKLDLGHLLEGNSQAIPWQSAVTMGIAQIVLIFLTPSIVSNIIGSATLQGTSNAAVSRGSALGAAAFVKLKSHMNPLKFKK